ncbi:phospholipase A and acyltransferase 3-like [Cololabis saira]|uniref:phospholipase A and acyltransferase 3-like n=1 Tax=Cololabis saira TaxID=129043 RepID=UPI002AD3CB60|nr:phospholipase A and acyltransferase 3-like [Cololabis saira]
MSLLYSRGLQAPGRSQRGSTSSGCTNSSETDTHRKELKPGDLIEIFRGAYKHWAVYVGGGNVVHFVTPGLGSSSSGVGVVGLGKVLKQKLQDVVEKDKWRVNNLLDHNYPPRPTNDIVKNACSLVDTELLYDLLKYNCEHFAIEMRYAKPESRQVKATVAGVAAGAAVLLGGGPVLVAGAVGVLVARALKN